MALALYLTLDLTLDLTLHLTRAGYLTLPLRQLKPAKPQPLPQFTSMKPYLVNIELFFRRGGDP